MEFATGAMGSLIPKLGELLLDEYNLKGSVKKGIGDLKAELESMQAALVKVSNVPQDQLDPQVKIWADEVRELSYAIEDSLDSSMVQIDGLELSKPHTLKGFIEKARNTVTRVKVRHKLADEIKDIKIQVREVKERYERYKINDVAANLATTMVDPRLLSMYNEETDLVGIGKATDELIERFSDGHDASKKKLRAVSVVGFGGLGKTTLAKVVYDKIKNTFQCRAFVPVGRNPDTKKVLKDILLELDKQLYMEASTMDERQLINLLREFLADKRYMIVIDDIWDIPTWKLIKCAMVDSGSGSRVMITTRISGVAEEVGGVYNIKQLSFDNSVKLFNSRIFGSDQGNILDSQSAEVSSKIMWKCGGVPLAIITMASLLASKRREEWSEVFESIGFGHEGNEVVENTRKILSFSYYDLPPHLKTCLLHHSVYPEEFAFDRDSSVRKWIAEGFIPSKPGTRLFDVGESYFNELVNRNMIMLIESWHIHGQVVCRIHDMVLDLIRTMSSEVKFTDIYDKEEEHITFSPNNGARRVAIDRGSVEHNPRMEMGHVRSFNAILWQSSRVPSLLSFRVLRVLVFTHCGFSMGGCDLEHLRKLVQLRYLEVYYTPAVKLPAEIGHDLKFLQSLDVRGSGIEELPVSVGELSKLMCLRAHKGTRLMFEIGKLTSLEALTLPSVDKSPNLFAQLGNLMEMRELEIGFDEISGRGLRDMVESLSKMRRMQTLSINPALTSGSGRLVYTSHMEDWRPPAVLRVLQLGFMVLQRRPSWLDSSCVPHLGVLSLQLDEVEEKDVRILGGLPSLHFLSFVVWEGNRPGGLFRYAVGTNELQKLRLLYTNMEIIFSNTSTCLPILEELRCVVTVAGAATAAASLNNMALLRYAVCLLDCQYRTTLELEAAEAALRHTAEIHRNHPTLQIVRVNEDYVDQLIRNIILEFQTRPLLHDGDVTEEEAAYPSIIASLQSLLLHGGAAAAGPDEDQDDQLSVDAMAAAELESHRIRCDQEDDTYAYVQSLRRLITKLQSLLPSDRSHEALRYIIERYEMFLQQARAGVSNVRDYEQQFLRGIIEIFTKAAAGQLPSDNAGASTSHTAAKEEEGPARQP